jgi:hypothetical protein
VGTVGRDSFLALSPSGLCGSGCLLIARVVLVLTRDENTAARVAGVTTAGASAREPFNAGA